MSSILKDYKTKLDYFETHLHISPKIISYDHFFCGNYHDYMFARFIRLITMKLDVFKKDFFYPGYLTKF